MSTDQESEEIRSEDEAEDQSTVQEAAAAPEGLEAFTTREPREPEAPAEELLRSLEAIGEGAQPVVEAPERPPAKEKDAEAPAESAGEAEAAGEAEEEDAEPEIHIPPDPDDGIRRRWYAIHAYSGQEGNVKRNLLVQAEQENMKDVIGAVLVPMEEVAEIKSGEKKISKRKFFPGYVLVRLPEHPERNPELWHLIKETPGVSGFIGSRSVPVPLDDAEINAIVDEIRGERERPKPKVAFEEGERIKIIDGPFSNFLGNISEINADRGVLKVMVEIFERLTSVEVEFWQVEKV